MRSKNLLLVIAVVTAFFASNLFAGLDTNIDPYQGVIEISAEALIGNVTYTFDGSLDYTVYAPGQYSGPISMPTTEFVYTYQINNDSDPASNLNVEQFSVGLVPDSGANYYAATSDAAPGEVIPMTGFGNSQTIYFMYIFNSISPGQSSALMLFSSPNAPVVGRGSVNIGTIGSVPVPIPTPVPEPVTLVLLGAGCLPIRYFRKRQRKAA